MRLLDPRFAYVKSVDTDIRDTLRKYGFTPTTEADRRAAQERLHGAQSTTPARVTNIRRKK